MPPTILQIVPSLDTGGAELSAVEIAGAVTAAGARSLVLSQGGRLVASLIEAGAEHVDFPAATKNPARILWNAARLARMIVAERVSLVHARSRAPAWSALLAARRTGVPFVTTYHGAYNESGPFKKAYNSVMARADVVIANSAYTADLVRTRYGIAPERLTVIHRGVDAGQFDRSAIAPERIARLRRRWGLPDGAPVILQPARLTMWKGQGVLIEAVRQLAEAGRLGSAHVVLAGSEQGRTAYRDDLAAAIATARLGGRVHLVGHVEDMPAAYAAADAVVIASIEPEAFGRTAVEAQAMGCPVIATRLGAPPETILAAPAVPREATTGWLVAPGDATALAGAIGEALGLSREARDAMALRARDHAASAFSLDAMRRATLIVYDRLLGTALVSRYRSAAPPFRDAT
ncbi:MAG: glycosyltransferase family 4 protein [Hyphomicrobiaceae bacterium]|nr:glycosyltransferase family 4 protein [Hyphomicrobiaceae bacterium]